MTRTAKITSQQNDLDLRNKSQETRVKKQESRNKIQASRTPHP